MLGMTPLRPLAMTSMMAASEPPYSHTLSVRLGAPMACIPVPSGMWQARSFHRTSAGLRRPVMRRADGPDSDNT